MTMIFSAAATRRLAIVSPMLAVGLLSSGCMSSPTYGTGVSANEQLLTDVSSIVSVAPQRKDPIDYKPRPELVKPAPGQATDLPAPQEQVAKAGNPDWPESPEQRRKRLRDEADANRDNAFYKPSIVNDVSGSGPDYTASQAGVTAKARDSGVMPAGQAAVQRREVQKKLAESRQGSSTTRRYLSEPPLDYRQPAGTAAADDLGEDELVKQRRAKKLATQPRGIKDYIPWL